MADLSLDLCGVKLKNPIIAASGTFGFGREYDELYDIGRLGGISVKGLSLLPRTGNPPSRIAETPSGMLNSVGLQNPGVESFIENDLPWLLTKDVAVIANITGTSVEQYVQMAERLAGTGVHLLEMNISCPNVHEGGVAFGVKPESVYAITKAVKAAAKQPLIVKLTAASLVLGAALYVGALVLPPLLAGLPRFRDEAAFLALVAGSLVLYPALVLGLIGRARLMGLLRGTPTAR